MKTLIIYESAFGNTEKIAFAIRDAMSESGDAAAFRPEDVGNADIQDYDLIVVGSPTQKFRPLPGVISFLEMLPKNGLKEKKVAAFDTRVDLQKVNNRFLNFMVWIFGYAAGPIAKKLEAKGGTMVAPAEGFLVEDTKGPLRDGELQRAKEWSKKLIGKV